MRFFEASIRPPVAQASIRAASLTSSPRAVTSARPPVVMLPTWRDDEKVVAALARAANASLGEGAGQPG